MLILSLDAHSVRSDLERNSDYLDVGFSPVEARNFSG